MDKVEFQCHIGMASAMPVPANFLSEPNFLDFHFARNSSGAVRFIPVSHLKEGPLVPGGAHTVDALNLHESLAQLLRARPKDGASKLAHIGLILAGYYSGEHGVLGVMFDRGFTTSDDPSRNPAFTSVAREGCAVFVGQIASIRTGGDFEREIEFTTIHELGHLFNLGHSNESCFMRSSLRGRAFPDDHFRFNAEQQKWLEQCPINPLVHPGGSTYKAYNGFNSARDGHHPRLALKIGVGDLSFACTAPLELDVKVMLKPNLTDTIAYVPDRLDPGYDEFRIWITDPNGERQLFRSARRYCSAPRRRAVTHNTPLTRDVSLFANPEGTPVFGIPGRYQLQAEFMVGRLVLVSNTIDVEAVSSSRMLSCERERLFASTQVRSLLYYRCIKQRKASWLNRLELHLQSEPRGHGAASLRYAIARISERRVAASAREKANLAMHVRILSGHPGELGIRQQEHIARIRQRLNL